MKKKVLRQKLAIERGEIKESIMEEPTIENKPKEKKTASKKKTTNKEKEDA